MDGKRIRELSEISARIKLGALEGVYSAASGHPGGSLSISDILAYLYFEEMNVDPADPKKDDRDRLVLSKGHSAPGLYAALALRGFFPTDDLKTLRQADSYLQGHPDMKGTPGVDMTTGSLGLGISAACGMALAGKVKKQDYRVYAIVGDGEAEEGQVWEAAMFAAAKKLDNLTLFLDFNGLQIDGPITDVNNPTPFDKKFEAFGWNVITINAHDFSEIEAAVQAAKNCSGRPTAIICRSVKGKGVSFMENNVKWHGSAPKKEEYEQAVSEINAYIASLGEV
ncbi:MAG: transketolase [Clostridia bacterium]|nr:transketolase [Clostridia bacterium]MBR5767914.1 transketolase [Clostridia bacterium]